MPELIPRGVLVFRTSGHRVHPTPPPVRSNLFYTLADATAHLQAATLLRQARGGSLRDHPASLPAAIGRVAHELVLPPGVQHAEDHAVAERAAWLAGRGKTGASGGRLAA